MAEILLDWTEGEETGKSEGKLSDFWDSTSSKLSNRMTQLVNMCRPSRKGENDLERGSEAIRVATVAIGLEGKFTAEG